MSNYALLNTILAPRLLLSSRMEIIPWHTFFSRSSINYGIRISALPSALRYSRVIQILKRCARVILLSFADSPHSCYEYFTSLIRLFENASITL